MSETHAPTARTRVVREAHRGVYERAAAYEILDEGFICHVGFVVDGQPFVIPTAYGRSGDNLYIHGSAASRMLRNLDKGVAGLHHGDSAGRAGAGPIDFQSLDELPFGGGAGHGGGGAGCEEKLEALKLLSEHILPGRWAESRQPNERELKQTLVLRLPIEEFSAKVRQGPPIDDEEDYSFPTWAGVIPLEMVAGAPINDPRLDREHAGAGVCARVFAQKIAVVVRSSLVLGLWSLAEQISHGFHGFTRIKVKDLIRVDP